MCHLDFAFYYDEKINKQVCIQYLKQTSLNEKNRKVFYR